LAISVAAPSEQTNNGFRMKTIAHSDLDRFSICYDFISTVVFFKCYVTTLSVPKINFYVYHPIVLDIITREINCCCWQGNLYLLLLLRLDSADDTWMNEYGALVEWYCQEKTEVLTKKPVPVTLNPMRNPHRLAVVLTDWGNLWSYKVSRQVLLLQQHALYTASWGQKLCHFSKKHLCGHSVNK
jgi:hypothetical protein